MVNDLIDFNPRSLLLFSESQGVLEVMDDYDTGDIYKVGVWIWPQDASHIGDVLTSPGLYISVGYLWVSVEPK